MPIQFQQLLPYAAGGSPQTTGPFTPNAAGDALFEFVLNPSTNNPITFSGGSTWSTRASGINPGTGVGSSIPCAGGSQTVTLTATGGGSLHCFGADYSGVASATSPTPVFQITPGTGTGAILGTSVTVPVGFVLLALCINFDSGTNTITSPAGTNRGNGLSADNFEFCFTEYAGAGAAIQPSFTSADGATDRFSVMQVLMTPGIPSTPIRTKARLMISIPKASADGKFYGRFPNGDAPVGVITGAATDFTSAMATLTTGGGGSVPGAPTTVQAFTDQGCVYVRFTPPASAGSSAITSYTATASTGQSTTQGPALISNSSTTFNTQMNLRIDINGMAGGVPVTVTVRATNASGTGPASAASNSVTPPSVLTPYFATPGNQNPLWGDFSFGGGEVIYGVAPGTPSSNGTGSFPAPTNPVTPSNNVVEMDNTVGFQPFIQAINPTSTLGGRFKLAPYSDLIFNIEPTQATPAQTLQIQFLKTVWVDGVATVGSSGAVLTDLNQNWPVNFFPLGSVVQNIRTGEFGFSVASNTSNTVTMNNAVTFQAGDYYQIAIPDQEIGLPLFIGGGSNPAGVIGPETLVVGQMNSYIIPLSLFNGGSLVYPQVTGQDILKVSNSFNNYASPSLAYICQYGFT